MDSFTYALVFQFATLGVDATVTGPFPTVDACRAHIAAVVDQGRLANWRTIGSCVARDSALYELRANACRPRSSQPAIGPLPAVDRYVCPRNGY